MNEPNFSSPEFIEKLKSGDPESVRLVVEKYNRTLFNAALGQGVSAEHAEEVVEHAEEIAEAAPEVAAAPPPMPEGVKEQIEEAGAEIAKAAGLSSIPDELLQLIVDKVEKIAWEVIPQIAEAVVAERIENLEKGKKE